MIERLAQIFTLLQWFCFIAVFYLTLHKIVAHLSRKPESKLLWFFGVLTAPLTLPVKRYSSPDASDEQIVTYSVVFYGILWFLVAFADRYWIK